MRKRAAHNRLFTLVYGQGHLPDIPSSIDISVLGMPASCAFKRFAISRTDHKAGIAHLRRIGRADYNNRDTASFGFIFDKASKLEKIPFAKAGSELFALTVSMVADTLQVLNSNALAAVFRSFNNALCDGVIHDRSRSALFSRKPFQDLSAALCAFGLKRRSNLLAFSAVNLKLFPGHFITGRKSCDIDDAKINTDKIFNIFNVLFGDFNGLEKIKLALFGHKISFTLDVWQQLFVVANKGNFQSSVDSPNRNRIGFIRKNAAIISNAAKRFERSYLFPFEFITINYFRKTADNHLGRKSECDSSALVANAMQFILIKNFIIPSNFRNIVTSTIGLLKRIQKRICLSIIWQKLDLQSQLHSLIIFTQLKLSTPKSERSGDLLAVFI